MAELDPHGRIAASRFRDWSLLDRPTISQIQQLTALLATYPLPGWSESEIRNTVNAKQYAVYTIQEKNDPILCAAVFRVIIDSAELFHVATAPDFRRFGLATRLLKESRESLVRRGVRCIDLEVEDANFAAIGLYESIGFRQIGKRKHYYGQGKDALLMKWEQSS